LAKKLATADDAIESKQSKIFPQKISQDTCKKRKL
jgi:hypothetical protein